MRTQKILCDDCHKWLARIEDGAVVLVCTRCKSEKRIPISDLIQHLEDWIAELRAMQENVAVPEPYFDKEEVAESAAHSSDVRPRVFAASRREDN